MKKTLVLLALALLSPAAAGAQAAPPIRGAAPGPMPATNGHGITVNGTAILRVPASSAHISLQLASVDNKNSLNQEALQPLVDALVKAGAERPSVQLPLAFSAGAVSNAATVTAVVPHPTVDTMRSGIASVGAVIAGMKDARLGSAQIQLKNDDCTETLTKVRANAISAARVKAVSIAKQLGVKLGSVISVSAFDYPSPDGSCASQYYVGPMGPQFPFGSESTDADYVTVPVTTNVTITYAIK